MVAELILKKIKSTFSQSYKLGVTPNYNNRHDIADILLKVALNTIKPSQTQL